MANKSLAKKLDKTFYQMLVSITLPIALQNIISYSVNLMDTVMLGALGEVALSAAALANQMFFIFTVVCFGVAGGAIVLASQYWGKQDTQSICKVMSIALKVTTGFGVVFTLFILVFPAQIMGVFTPEQAVIEAGVDYLRMVSLSYIFYGITSTFLVMLRSVETVNISLLIYSVSFVVNVFFNYVFIFGKFGAPALGVTGAAVGTVIARITEFIIMLVYLLKFEKKLKYRPYMLKWKDKELLGDIVRYGLPVLINESFWAVGTSVHSIILGHMGYMVVAANSICSVVFQMASSFIMGVGNASAVIVGKVVGQNDVEYAKLVAKKLKMIYFWMGIVSAGILLLIKNPIIAIYDIEPATVVIANQLMIAYAGAVFFMAFTCPLIMGVFRGSGDTKFAMVVDVGCLWLCIPIGAAAAFLFHLPPVAVFCCLRFEMVLKTVICLWRLRGDSWIRNVTR